MLNILHQTLQYSCVFEHFVVTKRYSVKGAPHYSRVVIILFRTGLCKSGFFTYSFVKLGFRLSVLVFRVSSLSVFQKQPPEVFCNKRCS